MWEMTVSNLLIREDVMNKQQLVEKISSETKYTKADCARVLDAMIFNVKKAVKKGDEVKLVGFGTFTKLKRKARSGVNPRTGEAIKIPSTWVPKFRAGEEFKTSV
jgi:DNA-binding protein HU-beta